MTFVLLVAATPMKGVLRCAATMPGALCVMMPGEFWMHLWPVGNLDSLLEVRMVNTDPYYALTNHQSIIASYNYVDTPIVVLTSKKSALSCRLYVSM